MESLVFSSLYNIIILSSVGNLQTLNRYCVLYHAGMEETELLLLLHWDRDQRFR